MNKINDIDDKKRLPWRFTAILISAD